MAEFNFPLTPDFQAELKPLPQEIDQFLKQQTIEETRPGTILRDFQMLLDFIGPEGIEVSNRLCPPYVPIRASRTVSNSSSREVRKGRSIWPKLAKIALAVSSKSG